MDTDTFYKVSNPTSSDISIMSKGVTYTLPADGTLDMIPESVMKHWSSLHAFLKFEKMKSIPVSKLAQIIEEKVEEVKESTEDTVFEETPVADESFAEEVAEEVTEEIVEEVVEKPSKKSKK